MKGLTLMKENSSNESDIEFYKCVESHTLSTLNLDWLLHEKSRFHGLHYETITIHPNINRYYRILRFSYC